MPRIIIKRRAAYADSLRDYKIYIDDKKTAKIEEGETQAYDLSEGKHTIYAIIDFHKSQKIEFDLTDNQEKYFELVSNMKFFKTAITLLGGLLLAKFIIGERHDALHSFYYLLLSFVLMIIFSYLLYIKNKYINLKEVEHF